MRKVYRLRSFTFVRALYLFKWRKIERSNKLLYIHRHINKRKNSCQKLKKIKGRISSHVNESRNKIQNKYLKHICGDQNKLK